MFTGEYMRKIQSYQVKERKCGLVNTDMYHRNIQQ